VTIDKLLYLVYALHWERKCENSR